MKHLLSYSLLVCLGLALGPQSRGAGASPQASDGPNASQLVARVHFAGPHRINADTNGSVFKEICRLPASTQLRDDALDKLAKAVAAQFQPKSPKPGANCVSLIRPLLNDLTDAEWLGELIEHPQHVLESTFALRLDEARSRLWQSNWSQLLSGWQWQAGRGEFSYLATNSWFAVHFVAGPTAGAGKGVAESALWRKMQQGQRPVASAPEHWLKVEGDLARCSKIFGKAERKNLPRIDLTVTGRKEYLRTQGKLTFREPILDKVEPWQIPTEIIRDPLISFTAAQGMAPWLRKQPLIQELGLNQIPNQLFVWGLSQSAFQIQAAVPAHEAAEAFNRIREKWIPNWNKVLEDYVIGSVKMLTNRTELLWRGLPIVVPYLEVARDQGREYLHGGIFPVAPPTNAPPAALFQQLTSHTNLVYYDWEVTQAQLDQVRPLLQVSAAFLTVSPMSTNSSPSQWLDAAGPRLGNTITEVTATSPRELQLMRTAHVGFNGLELLTLASWLEGTNFPHFDPAIWFRPTPTSSKKAPSH